MNSMTLFNEATKQDVYQFWNAASCGEDLYLRSSDAAGYMAESAQRYKLEPYIPDFARFDSCGGLDVLEIGVGLGADHAEFARCGANMTGIDLTDRAIAHTKQRLDCLGLHSRLAVGDAERLEFADGSFDVVYSWGVLHHSPATPVAIREVWRVLRPSGVARIMIYHKWSLIGLMLWVRYALFRLKPFTSLSDIYATYLESPGTKAYSCAEAKNLFSAFGEVSISTVLTHGDLLSAEAGQRHRGKLLSVMRAIWPRWLIRRMFPRCGLFMLIEARK
jgi:SAM-dependent methyltransferase